MSSVSRTKTELPADLWKLVLGPPQIDPHLLADALRHHAPAAPLDFRSRLLIRDALQALRSKCGNDQVEAWLGKDVLADRIRAIEKEDLGPAGFGLLERRLVNRTDPETILRFLRELGSRIDSLTTVNIGGSASLVLLEYLARQTEDIDLVDEVPPAIRTRHDLLDELAQRHGLKLAHFQSRSLLEGWESRRHALGEFDKLQVYLVDPLDVALSKLFSKRAKDLDDLRMLADRLAKQSLAQRLHAAGRRLLAEPDLCTNATTNWFIVYGEPLPA
jgi:hypothetical protein